MDEGTQDSCCAAEVAEVENPNEGQSEGDDQTIEEIASIQDAISILATFNKAEELAYLQAILMSAQSDDAAALRNRLAALAMQPCEEKGHEAGEVHGSPAATAAPGNLTPEEIARIQQEALDDAVAQVCVALESIAVAELFLPEMQAFFQRARERLQAITDPLALGAADAQQLIHQVSLTFFFTATSSFGSQF